MQFQSLDLELFKPLQFDEKKKIMGGTCDGPTGATATVSATAGARKDSESAPCDDLP